MIGMVAFIVDVPGGFTDPATVLPVQIFIWADSAGTGFPGQDQRGDHGAGGVSDPDERPGRGPPQTLRATLVKEVGDGGFGAGSSADR